MLPLKLNDGGSAPDIMFLSGKKYFCLVFFFHLPDKCLVSQNVNVHPCEWEISGISTVLPTSMLDS